MLREDTVFGPVRSRRLGHSLGVNLLPSKGKLCNFDCIYCECGWNRDGRTDDRMPSAAEVRSALEERLCTLMLDGAPVDSITFSGDGEPTLNPEFPRIVDDALKLRNAYYPDARVSVLSNATRLHIPEVFGALRRVDNPIMKLDAPTNALAARINRPSSSYDVRKVVEQLKAFDGDFILQTMFLRSRDFDSSSLEILEPMKEIILKLKPRLVMAYTIDRPTPQEGLEAFSEKELAEMTEPLRKAGISVDVYGPAGNVYGGAESLK